MLEALVFAVLKAIATTCVKYYITSLLEGGRINYKESELGYKVPAWYMNPGNPDKTLFSYGTSVEGDEFQSIEDARKQAIAQMAKAIRQSNRKLVDENIHFDASSVKQRRLIDLFVRGEGLEEFLTAQGKLDRKDLVKIKGSHPADIRAFVRLALPAEDYIAYQQKSVNELKVRLTQQKTEDIMAEMDAEVKAWDDEEKAGLPAPEAPPVIEPPAAEPFAPAPEPAPPAVEPAATPADVPSPVPVPAPELAPKAAEMEAATEQELEVAPVPKQAPAAGAFGELESELDQSGAAATP